MSEITIQIRLSQAEYRALAKHAEKRDTQAHRLVEALVRRALDPQPKPIPNRRGGPRPSLPDDLCPKVAEGHARGLNDMQIAAELGVHRSVVRHRRLFLKLPGARRGRPSQLENERSIMPDNNTPAPDLTPSELATVQRFGLDREDA